MKNIKTRYIKTAMNNIAWRIRTDLVMSVAFIKREIGGHFLIWITEAGDNKIIWQIKFIEGVVTEINLPDELINEN